MVKELSPARRIPASPLSGLGDTEAALLERRCGSTLRGDPRCCSVPHLKPPLALRQQPVRLKGVPSDKAGHAQHQIGNTFDKG